jgi:hypothetical protein
VAPQEFSVESSPIYDSAYEPDKHAILLSHKAKAQWRLDQRSIKGGDELFP